MFKEINNPNIYHVVSWPYIVCLLYLSKKNILPIGPCKKALYCT